MAAAACAASELARSSPGTAARDGMYFPVPVTQSETDEYTSYELLAPETASFRIRYEVTATTAGARYFYNPIRKGSVASDESVLDAMRGSALPFEVVSGSEARKDPLMPDADAATDYIKVTLPRAVPERGQSRLLILKTYRDPKSYYLEGKTLVFSRPLGVKRNKVVLPPGYEVVSLSVPSQVRTEPGRAHRRQLPACGSRGGTARAARREGCGGGAWSDAAGANCAAQLGGTLSRADRRGASRGAGA